MSFRGRLRLFFALIVIVPMTALGVVIFALTERTETGKADAGLGTAARTALALHRDQVNAARPGDACARWWAETSSRSGCGPGPAGVLPRWARTRPSRGEARSS